MRNIIFSKCINSFAIAFVFCATCMGCTNWNARYEMSADSYPQSTQKQEANFIGTAYALADTILNNLPATVDKNTSKLIVLSFADINKLEQSSTFGRMMAEHVSSRLVQRGMLVSDIRIMSDTILVRQDNGEFVLTRNAKRLALNVDSAFILAGTYADMGNDIVTLSLRLIRGADKIILATADASMKL